MQRMEFLGILIVLLFAGLNEIADGRRIRISYRSRSPSSYSRSSSYSSYSSYSSNVRYSTYSEAVVNGYYVSGKVQYNKRFNGTESWNSDPTVCLNSTLKNTYINKIQQSGYFVCPSDQDDDDDIYCCGVTGDEYCCSFWESSNRDLVISAVVAPSLIVIIIILITVCCCIRKRKRQKSMVPSYEYYAADKEVYPCSEVDLSRSGAARFPPASGCQAPVEYQSAGGIPTNTYLYYILSKYSKSPLTGAADQPLVPHRPDMEPVSSAVGSETSSPPSLPPSYDAANGYPAKNSN